MAKYTVLEIIVRNHNCGSRNCGPQPQILNHNCGNHNFGHKCGKIVTKLWYSIKVFFFKILFFDNNKNLLMNK